MSVPLTLTKVMFFLNVIFNLQNIVNLSVTHDIASLAHVHPDGSACAQGAANNAQDHNLMG